MSEKVVTLEGRPVENAADLNIQAHDAAVALKALVAKIEAREIVAGKWLLLYEEPLPNGRARTSYLDSDLSVEQAMFMLESAKYDIFHLLKST